MFLNLTLVQEVKAVSASAKMCQSIALTKISLMIFSKCGRQYLNYLIRIKSLALFES